MATLTTTPVNRSYLSNNKFDFVLKRIPNFTYLVQGVNLPGLTLQSSSINTPFSAVSIPGNQITFGTLSLTFLVDEDMKNYLGAYAKEFDTPGSMSRKEWEEDRRVRIESKAKITVKLDALKVETNGDKATVKFRQDYRADKLAVSSRKTLQLVKRGDRWQIVRETVGG